MCRSFQLTWRYIISGLEAGRCWDLFFTTSEWCSWLVLLVGFLGVWEADLEMWDEWDGVLVLAGADMLWPKSQPFQTPLSLILLSPGDKTKYHKISCYRMGSNLRAINVDFNTYLILWRRLIFGNQNRCYEVVHSTTQWKMEYRIMEGFGCWLQLMCCVNLLLWI